MDGGSSATPQSMHTPLRLVKRKLPSLQEGMKKVMMSL